MFFSFLYVRRRICSEVQYFSGLKQKQNKQKTCIQKWAFFAFVFGHVLNQMHKVKCIFPILHQEQQHEEDLLVWYVPDSGWSLHSAMKAWSSDTGTLSC